MDRRLLLAVALSAIVLVLFQTLISPPADRKTPPPHDAIAVNDDPSRETESAEPVGLPPDASGEPRSLDRAGSEITITLSNPQVDASFTNRGGQISSWRLREFQQPDGTPVQIVADGQEFATRLETPTGVLELGETLFEAHEEPGPEGSKRVRFEARSPEGLRVTKTYTIPAEGYLATLETRIEGAGQATGYRTAWDGGIPLAEKNEKTDRTATAMIALLGTRTEKLDPGKFKRSHHAEIEGAVWWAGVRNKYFLALMVPPQGEANRLVATGDYERFIVGAEVAFPIVDGSAQHAMGLYLGPQDHERLKAIGHGLDRAVDLGFKFIRPISQVLMITMNAMYRIVPNYGVVIILVSVLTKLLFYPLTKSSLKSMRTMQRLQPEMQRIKEQYKGDPKRQQQKTMEIYKEHKVNPVGGCLPLVVQMPVFFALYSVLSNSIHMRGAPFFGWIHDLSVPDTLFSVGGFPIHVLPVVMFGTSILQAKLTPTGGDPRQKMIGYMMPAVMLFIFYSFPAGLNLYWTINNALQVAQQWAIHREHPAPVPAPSVA